jgi:hypothetical protein
MNGSAISIGVVVLIIGACVGVWLRMNAGKNKSE